MKVLLSILFSLIMFNVGAQSTLCWEGGKAGKEFAWDESRNWSKHCTPDEYCHVIIARKCNGHNVQPEIKNTVTLASLEIHAGCTLLIKKGATLIIDGLYTYSNGIVLNGEIVNNGIIIIKNVDHFNTESFLNNLIQNGRLYIDGANLAHK